MTDISYILLGICSFFIGGFLGDYENGSPENITIRAVIILITGAVGAFLLIYSKIKSQERSKHSRD